MGVGVLSADHVKLSVSNRLNPISPTSARRMFESSVQGPNHYPTPSGGNRYHARNSICLTLTYKTGPIALAINETNNGRRGIISTGLLLSTKRTRSGRNRNDQFAPVMSPIASRVFRAAINIARGEQGVGARISLT